MFIFRFPMIVDTYNFQTLLLHNIVQGGHFSFHGRFQKGFIP